MIDDLYMVVLVTLHVCLIHNVQYALLNLTVQPLEYLQTGSAYNGYSS